MLEKILQFIEGFLNRPAGGGDRFAAEYRLVVGQVRFLAQGRAFRLVLLLALTLGLLCLLYGCGEFSFSAKMTLAAFGFLNTALLAVAERAARRRCAHLKEVALGLENALDSGRTRKMMFRDAPAPGWFTPACAVDTAYLLAALLWVFAAVNVWCVKACGDRGRRSDKACFSPMPFGSAGPSMGDLPPGHPPLDGDK